MPRKQQKREKLLFWLFGGAIVIGWCMYFFTTGGNSAIPIQSAVSLPPISSAHRSVSPSPTIAAEMTVYVVGSVRHPGLYKVPLDSRIADIVSRAGGATQDADLSAIDMAAVAQDGMEIVIPSRTSVESGLGDNGQDSSNVPALGSELGVRKTHKRKHKRKLQPGERINLNKSNLSMLEELPGVGPKKAGAILSYRSAHGFFTSIAELRSVQGIGEGLFQRISSYLTL